MYLNEWKVFTNVEEEVRSIGWVQNIGALSLNTHSLKMTLENESNSSIPMRFVPIASGHSTHTTQACPQYDNSS